MVGVAADRVESLFACPSCRLRLRFAADHAACPRCQIAVPIIDGFVLWTERHMGVRSAIERGHEICAGQNRYRELLERKHDRNIYEPYAWFRPFNESTRALEVFRRTLMSTIEPGHAILDMWCRTGWTGEMLASWFPENQIVSLWEGDRDHLGYHGFMHWLAPGARARNLTVVFADPNEPLPFANDSFALVHGLDTLHRYQISPLMGECLRVATDGAPLIFPHIHLTNSEPDPFFERGCTQLHGSVWGDFLDEICSGTQRDAWVLAERDLYMAAEPKPLADDRLTEHYNGFAVIGPRSWQGAQLTPPRPELHDDAFLFANPLVSIEYPTGRSRIDREALSGTIGHMVDRHPVAVEALAPATDRQLTSLECQIMAHAQRPICVADVAKKLDLSSEALAGACEQLVNENMLQIERVSPAMAQLQGHYHSLQPERQNNFASLWETLAIRYGPNELLLGSDGSTFGFEDVDALVQAVRAWFAEHQLAPGSRVAFLADGHIEYCIMIWAAWLSGLSVVPLSPELSDAHILEALEIAGVAAVGCDQGNGRRLDALPVDLPVVVFDPAEEPTRSGHYFVDEIGPFIGMPSNPGVESLSSAEAAIIFTSGSSGRPKAVRLSIGSLLHTGTVMGHVLGLRNGDRLLSLAPLHTMSGLRNPLVAALRRGTALVVAPECAASALAVVEACRQFDVNVLAGGPVLVDRLAALNDRIRPKSLANLRTIATTADRLDPTSAAVLQEQLDVQVVDYYGLTETGGVVLAAATGSIGNLGIPVGAAVEVHHNGSRAPLGAIGEIRVAGPSLMSGYLTTRPGVRFESGWVYTGDRGVTHDDGSMSLLGRMREQVKRRNGEIYPHERVITALQARDNVHRVELLVDQTERHLVLELVGTGLDEPEIRSWIEHECGVEGIPDRFSLQEGSAN